MPHFSSCDGGATTLQLDQAGNLCWQSIDAAGHYNEVLPQLVIESHQQQNPLDVAIQEIIEVTGGNHSPAAPSTTDAANANFESQMTRFADKLKSLRQKYGGNNNMIPREDKVFVCDKCGREYKYKSFLQVHQKRKCW